MTRTIVALNPPRRAHDFLAFAKVVALRLAEDPLFAPPPPLLATLNANLVALEAALAAVLTRRFGAAAERKARQDEVLGTLSALRTYVQALTDTLPANEAPMVAARAGMFVKDAKGPTRATLTVKAGRVSGTAHAYARAAKSRAGYEWQVAHGGGDWVSVPFTTRADVELTGLEPGSTIEVRARTTTADGPSDWIGPVRYLVV